MLVEVSVTCENKKEAKKIAQVLLRKKLVACANWFEVESLFWWKRKITGSQEVLLILKTSSAKTGEVKKEVVNLCSYELPVVTAKLINVNSAAQRWLKKSTNN